MEMKNVYPDNLKNKGRGLLITRKVFAFILWIGAIASVIVNLSTGKPWWCAVVCVSVFAVHRLLLSPQLVERNMIGLFINLASYASLVLLSIGLTLSEGWDMFVIPIVCAGTILICTLLFLFDTEGQKNSVHSSAVLSFICTVAFLIGFLNLEGRDKLVMGICSLVSAASLIVYGSVLRTDFFREFKRRFHVK